MKKYLLLTFAGVLFASVSAFAHCGSCGVGDKPHADTVKAECAKECAKASCEVGAECAKDCAKACCAVKAECAEGCTKPCCAKPAAGAAEPTAAAAPSSCCASKLASPA